MLVLANALPRGRIPCAAGYRIAAFFETASGTSLQLLDAESDSTNRLNRPETLFIRCHLGFYHRYPQGFHRGLQGSEHLFTFVSSHDCASGTRKVR